MKLAMRVVLIVLVVSSPWGHQIVRIVLIMVMSPHQAVDRCLALPCPAWPCLALPCLALWVRDGGWKGWNPDDWKVVSGN